MRSFDPRIQIIVDTLRDAGYDPYSQLYGYVTTGNAAYITRTNGARELIAQIEKDELTLYLWTVKHG